VRAAEGEDYGAASAQPPPQRLLLLKQRQLILWRMLMFLLLTCAGESNWHESSTQILQAHWYLIDALRALGSPHCACVLCQVLQRLRMCLQGVWPEHAYLLPIGVVVPLVGSEAEPARHKAGAEDVGHHLPKRHATMPGVHKPANFEGRRASWLLNLAALDLALRCLCCQTNKAGPGGCRQPRLTLCLLVQPCPVKRLSRGGRTHNLTAAGRKIALITRSGSGHCCALSPLPCQLRLVNRKLEHQQPRPVPATCLIRARLWSLSGMALPHLIFDAKDIALIASPRYPSI
jgi:hypothetical protein